MRPDTGMEEDMLAEEGAAAAPAADTHPPAAAAPETEAATGGTASWAAAATDGTASWAAAATDGTASWAAAAEGRPEKPKKAAYRQRAHCNPLSDSYIVYPRNPDYVDWSLHFPGFFSPADSSSRSSSSAAAAEGAQAVGSSAAAATPSVPAAAAAPSPRAAAPAAALAAGSSAAGTSARPAPAAQASRSLFLNTDRHPVSYPEVQPASVNGTAGPRVEFLDVGCGFGGLLVSLAPRFPKTLFLGVEIREKVTNYVGERIDALRREHAADGRYQNIAVLRTNVMKFLVNYIRKGQLSKMFFCFPDPHFKRSNWRRRIINLPLLSVYAFVLRPGGLLYTVTDVEDLHKWMRQALLLHPLFEEVPLDQLADDPCIAAIERDTEEGMKVERLGQPCYTCVFRRLPDLPLCCTC